MSLRVPVRGALVLAIAVLCASAAQALPSYDEVRAAHRPSDTLVLDRQGALLQRLRTDSGARRGAWVALADVSPALRTAMVLSEDKRFYEHSGVDWQAVSAAAWGNLFNSRTRGASTITMQLAGLLDEDWQRGAGGRSVAQKLGQTVAAKVLERRWRKDQILEAYLNTVPFRGELVGIDALSRTLFGKAPHGLDAREAAVAAALVRAPNARPALVSHRACGVLRALQSTPRVDCEGLDLFTTAALARRDYAASEGIAPHAARRVLATWSAGAMSQSAGRPGPSTAGSSALPPATSEVTAHTGTPATSGATVPAVVRTTLSAPLQRFAQDTLQRHLRELHGRNVEDGALVVLDNASGEVLAWVGSSGALSQAAEVDGVLAPRQPGSTLKPFLYGQALAERRITAASLLEDSPAHIPTASGLYIPQNYDRQFKGWVSARTALASSLNVPAVRTLVMVSPDAFARQLRAAGLPLRESGDYYGYSLALGSAELPLLALTNAYRTLANGGRYGPVSLRAGTPLPGQPPAAQALDARAAFIVGDILSDGNARARTFGIDSVLATRFWTAVKTGTSKDMRDNWAVGWSQRYTVGVWVGNARGAPMWDVSGTSGAAPVWAETMRYLHTSTPSRAPAPPPGLVQARVDFGRDAGTDRLAGSVQPVSALVRPTAARQRVSADDGAWTGELEAARSEWFIRGTEQTRFRRDTADGTRGGAAAALRITAPADGTIVALDPDIPPQRQRLAFTASSANGRWLLDGKPWAQGAQVQWLPWPGKHRVQLLDARGQVVDEVRVEVRGAGVRASGDRGRPASQMR